jgi:hypothetical protein
MTAPKRQFLLNRQIAVEARRIAHKATKTCKIMFDRTDHDDEHTKNCNALKREIEKLALQVKLASLQAPQRDERDDDEDDPNAVFEETNNERAQ